TKRSFARRTSGSRSASACSSAQRSCSGSSASAPASIARSASPSPRTSTRPCARIPPSSSSSPGTWWTRSSRRSSGTTGSRSSARWAWPPRSRSSSTGTRRPRTSARSLRAERARHLPQRSLLRVAHLLAGEPEEPFPVRLGDLLRERQHELPVVLDLLGRGLLLEQPDRVAEAAQPIGFELVHRLVQLVVELRLRVHDLVEQLALA